MSLSVDAAAVRPPAPGASPDDLPLFEQASGRESFYLGEFQARHPDLLASYTQQGRPLQLLKAVFRQSRFLSEELLQHPAWIGEVDDLYRVLPAPEYQQRLRRFVAGRDVSEIRALDLALFRRRELLRILVRDTFRFGALSEITEELSNLADAVLQAALDHVLAELTPRYGAPQLPEAHDSLAFTVLALGKLGGRELNYSSDIDLLFLYGDNGETSGPERISHREFYKKVANRLTDLLSTYTAEGLCYRVDLRLRPEGRLGEVCMSLAGACDYYARRARDWELQMLIKARVAAGDPVVGQAFLDAVESAIYSTTLDFSAIETVSETRERIGEKLRARRGPGKQLDLKLTRGGIRDIEFLVQCLQRLHGGRHGWLRHGGTLLALSRLRDKDLLSATEFARLANAYQFLRNLEHRLQVEDDKQTHTLPEKEAELDRLAERLGLPVKQPGGAEVSGHVRLIAELREHLDNVQALYDRVVHAQGPLGYTLPPHTAPLPEDAPTIYRDAPSDQEVSPNLLRSLQVEAPQFAAWLRDRGLRRAHRAFEHFLERVLETPRYLALLNDQPMFSEYVAQLFEKSPYLAEQLIRSVDLLEEVGRVAEHPPVAGSRPELPPLIEEAAALRRFFRRQMFAIQVASICVPEPVFQTLDRTSTLIELAISLAYQISRQRAVEHAQHQARALGVPFAIHKDMMVVALGRLGMREIDLASDADLLFIIPDEEAVRQPFWTRVAAHMIEILSAYTGDGTIVSIDTRLRPDGREGQLVQTESKYVDYFAHRAEAWEGLAFMKARAVAGDLDRATEFLSSLQLVDWRRYGQSRRSRQELRNMRMRLEREQGLANSLKAGCGGYYDADFALMYLRLKGAGLFFKTLNTPERIDIVEKMGHLERADAEFLLKATTFYRALDHALRLLTGHAEGTLPTANNDLEIVSELVASWTGDQIAPGQLGAVLGGYRTEMRELFGRLFA